ncbi:MAG: metallopeptidase family protein [Actinobacteria bacterium ATB1]|nr:metallopeptidase family protein [Actinobacteria bacterium ATB1]
MTDDEFEELVVDALDTVPPELASLMDNIVVMIEERSEEDPDLLGLYVGVDLTARSPLAYGMELPDTIVVYRQAHFEAAESEVDLRELVRETVLHEIAHHFGIDDGRLDELGWS